MVNYTLLLETIECDAIPGKLKEVSTSEKAALFPHLADLVSVIPPLYKNAKISLLHSSSNTSELLKVREF